jgi:hypothetical protein
MQCIAGATRGRWPPAAPDKPGSRSTAVCSHATRDTSPSEWRRRYNTRGGLLSRGIAFRAELDRQLTGTLRHPRDVDRRSDPSRRANHAANPSAPTAATDGTVTMPQFALPGRRPIALSVTLLPDPRKAVGGMGISREIEAALDPADEGLAGMLLQPQDAEEASSSLPSWENQTLIRRFSANWTMTISAILCYHR